MIQAFKNKRTYIIGAVLLFLAIAVPYGILGITLLPSLNTSPFEYEILIWVFFIMYILIGYVSFDLYRVRWRRKTKTWDGAVSEEISIKSWNIGLPFFLPAAILSLLIIFNEIFALVTGAYPLLG